MALPYGSFGDYYLLGALRVFGFIMSMHVGESLWCYPDSTDGFVNIARSWGLVFNKDIFEIIRGTREIVVYGEVIWKKIQVIYNSIVIVNNIRVVNDLIIENSCIRVRHVAQIICVCIIIVIVNF